MGLEGSASPVGCRGRLHLRRAGCEAPRSQLRVRRRPSPAQVSVRVRSAPRPVCARSLTPPRARL